MSSGCSAAEALVLSFPVWNFGYPAILKGFFDRVFLPGVSFDLLDDGGVVPALHQHHESSPRSAPMAARGCARCSPATRRARR